MGQTIRCFNKYGIRYVKVLPYFVCVYKMKNLKRIKMIKVKREQKWTDTFKIEGYALSCNLALTAAPPKNAQALHFIYVCEE